MDQELKAKWMESLRSGRYPQTRSCLKDSDGFCCLGVLADIQGAEWDGDQPRLNGDFAGHEEGGWLKESVAGGLHLRVQRELSNLNDGGAHFIAIADFIDKNL